MSGDGSEIDTEDELEAVREVLYLCKSTRHSEQQRFSLFVCFFKKNKIPIICRDDKLKKLRFKRLIGHVNAFSPLQF